MIVVVVPFMVISPVTIKLPPTLALPPIFAFSAIPTPPVTFKAPVVELVDGVLLGISTTPAADTVAVPNVVIPVTVNAPSNVTVSSTFNVPKTVVITPAFEILTTPPPVASEVAPVESNVTTDVSPVTSNVPSSLVEPVTSNFSVGAVVPFPIPKLPVLPSKNILAWSLIQKRISLPSLALRRVNPLVCCHKA